MASSDKSPVVLNFGMPWRAAKTEYLLWPLLAYRTMAPVGRSLIGVNLLERTFLGLARAGVRDPGQIANLTGVATKLAFHVCASLIDRAEPLLDSTLRPTADGDRLLDDVGIEERKQVAGWIFQDPWTGELWPRFVSELPTVPVNVFPELELGTEGKPFTYSPIVMAPPAGAIASPRPQDVLRSVRIYTEKDTSRKLEVETDLPTLTFRDEELGKVTYLESQPEQVFALTAVVIRDGDWTVRDPFFPNRESMRLRKAIRLRIGQSERLAKRLASMLGIDVDQTAGSLAEFVQQADVAAEMEIQARFGDLASRSGLEDRLVDLERRRVLLRGMGPGAATLSGDVAIATQALLERVMKVILKQYSSSRIRSALDKRNGNERCHMIDGLDVAAFLRGIGFSDVPDTLLSPKQSALFVALTRQIGSLMPLTLAASLTSLVHDRHVFKKLGVTRPGTLREIAQIAEWRNESAHDNAGTVGMKRSTDEVDRLAGAATEIAFAVCSALDTRTGEAS